MIKPHRIDATYTHADIANMHTHYGFDTKIDALTPAQKFELLKFRVDFLTEELDDIKANSTATNFVADEVVDGLIDLIVVAVGTLDIFEVDMRTAWDRVHQCNMSKEVGVKPTRPNPLGLPDLIKPSGWAAPTHQDNLGTLEDVENYVKML